jgi:drug/metabolite transporter (DMT)-like permease/DNA-binding XRE family transcriptional regulator
MTPRDFSLLILTCVLWATHTIVSKVVVSGMEVPPLFYAAIRYGLVAVVALPWLLPVPRPAWRILCVGFLMGGGGFALFFLGIKTATPSSAAIVGQLSLPLTVLLSIGMLGETITVRRGVGVVLTFLGGVIVMWNPANGFSLSGGLLLVLGSALAASLAAVMMKQIEDVRPLQFQAWVGAASVVPLVMLTAAFETDQYSLALAAGWPFVMAVLFSALIVSMLAHTIYYGLIRIYPANLIAPLIILSPLLTVIMGIFITQDAFDLRMTLGTIIALLGLTIITVRRNPVTAVTARFGRLRRNPGRSALMTRQDCARLETGGIRMADVFRVPMEVTYAIEGGEPALLAYRRWRNLSRDELAAKSGISKADIEAIEDGKKDIEEDMLERLSTVLKVPEDQLI